MAVVSDVQPAVMKSPEYSVQSAIIPSSGAPAMTPKSVIIKASVDPVPRR